MSSFLDDDDDRGPNALHLAAGDGDVELVSILLATGAYIESRDWALGFTALHWAALSGQVEVVKYLLEHGADVNALSHDDMPPLLLAVSGHHAEVAALLREHGAWEGEWREPIALLEGREVPAGDEGAPGAEHACEDAADWEVWELWEVQQDDAARRAERRRYCPPAHQQHAGTTGRPRTRQPALRAR